MKNNLENIRHYCLENRKTIAAAESVTAGCIQTALSILPDAQDFFQGGITAYNCGQKARHLSVDPIYAYQCNAVHPDIAVKMAREVCLLFCSDIGISSTGYAAPMPEKNVHTPFAYFAIVYNGKVVAADKVVATTTDYGLEVQKEYTDHILRCLSEILA